VTRLAVVPVGPVPEQKLRRDEKRLKRRRLAMVRNRAQASTPQELLAIAFDFFRAMTVDPSIDQRERDAQSALMAQMLEDRGNQLAKPRRRNR
jgi:hypothetical protein